MLRRRSGTHCWRPVITQQLTNRDSGSIQQIIRHSDLFTIYQCPCITNTQYYQLHPDGTLATGPQRSYELHPHATHRPLRSIRHNHHWHRIRLLGGNSKVVGEFITRSSGRHRNKPAFGEVRCAVPVLVHPYVLHAVNAHHFPHDSLVWIKVHHKAD